MAKLEIMNGKSEGEAIELPDGETVEIGTKRSTFLRLRDQGVSYVHASLTLKGDTLILEDRRSRAGTFIGDDKLGAEPVELASGAVFKVGSVELRFAVPAADAAPAAPAAPTQGGGADPAALEAAEKARAALEKHNAELIAKIAELQARLDEVEEIASDGVETVNETEERCRAYEDQISALEDQSRALESAGKKSESARKKLAEEVTGLREVAARLPELEEELKAARGEISGLRQDLAHAKTALSQSEERQLAAETERDAVHEQMEELKQSSEAERKRIKKELEEARRSARRSPAELVSGKDLTIAGADFEGELKADALAAFENGAQLPETEDEDLAGIKDRVARSAKEIEALESDGVTLPSAEDLETQLLARDEEVQRLRDELSAKCEEVEELNVEYSETLEELEKLKGS